MALAREFGRTIAHLGNTITSGWLGAASTVTSCLRSLQVGAAIGPEIVNRLVRQRVEPALTGILFELPVPGLSIELVKPCTEGGEFRSRQLPHSLFNFCARGHCV